MSNRHTLARARRRERLVAIAALELANRHALETTGELPAVGSGGRHRAGPGRPPFALVGALEGVA